MAEKTEKNEGRDKTEENKGTDEKITLPKKEHELLLSQAKELEAVQDKFLRSAADYDNAKRRLAKEREEFLRYSQEKLLRELLPILDNFERALAHSEASSNTETNSAAVVAGVELIWKQCLDLLKAHGLKRITSEGEAFDPHLHEAVEQVEEKGPEGIIVKELVAGYLLYDRLLRPAKVRIRVREAKAEKRVEEKEEELT